MLIGGTMGTSSYILRGTAEGMERAFGSACHGAGRLLSRSEAKRRYGRDDVARALTQALADAEWTVRYEAIQALGALRPAPMMAVVVGFLAAISFFRKILGRLFGRSE